MALFAGLALVFLLVVAVVGTVSTLRRARRVAKEVRSSERVIGRAVDDAVRRATVLTEHLEETSEGAARLEAALARLRTSRARAAVLVAATREVRTAVRRVLAAVPSP